MQEINEHITDPSENEEKKRKNTNKTNVEVLAVLFS
jgi:hypothetical protein